MIRPSSAVRHAVAFAGAAGVLALAGCASTTDADAVVSSAASPTTAASTSSAAGATAEAADATSAATSTSTYADGTYTAEGSYQTPESIETISVTVTLESDIVTSVTVTGDPQARESQQYQAAFISGIESEVVGVDIDDLAVDKVAGSSLTSTGFNAAIAEIKTEAAT